MKNTVTLYIRGSLSRSSAICSTPFFQLFFPLWAFVLPPLPPPSFPQLIHCPGAGLLHTSIQSFHVLSQKPSMTFALKVQAPGPCMIWRVLPASVFTTFSHLSGSTPGSSHLFDHTSSTSGPLNRVGCYSCPHFCWLHGSLLFTLKGFT